jgi:hypothetical protein
MGRPALFSLAALCVVLGHAWNAGAAEGDPTDSADAQAWWSHEQPPPWVKPRELVDAPKWDVGGAVLVPEAQVPIFLTDPFGGAALGQSWRPSVGYGVQWRLGFALGRVSFEPLAGYSEVSRDLSLAGQGPLKRAWVGGQLRMTFPGAVVSPFVAAGGEDNIWNAPVLARAGGRAAEIDAVWAPGVHILVGMRIRIATIAGVATVFGDAGLQANYFFQGDVFESDQVAVAPYVGIDVMGLAPSLQGSDRKELHGRL